MKSLYARERRLVSARDAVLGETPLEACIHQPEQHLQAVEFLLASGADPNGGSNGLSPLWWAAEWGHGEIAIALFDAGADVNPRVKNPGGSGWTPLHIAVFEGHLQVVKILVARGADLDAVGNDGMTPVQVAQEGGNPQNAGRVRQVLAFLKQVKKEGRP